MVRTGHAEAQAPQRSCLGCRTAKNKHLLLRFVLSPDGEVLPDLDARLPGRGAYTCMKAACLISALEQRQFRRAFKQDVVTMTPDAMVNHIRQQLSERVIGLIGLANKAGVVSGGGSLVSDELRGRIKPGLVLVAGDVSVAIGEKIVYLARAHQVQVQTVLTKDDFGSILGKTPRSAIAIRSGGFVNPLLKAIERYRNFLGEV